jgi:molybdopterin/thiamine biosynthesis adenylyltransferase
MERTSFYIEKYGDGIQIKDTILLSFNDDSVIFFNGEGLTLNKLKPEEVYFLKALQSGMKMESFLNSISSKRLGQIVEVLEGKNILKTAFYPPHSDPTVTRQIDWLSCFKKDPAQIQKIIENKKIFLLGCGGTGSIIAMHLARAGFKNFILIDSGTVDAPDLNRQLTYYEKDLGTKKVVALSQYLKGNLGVKIVEEYDLFIDGQEQLDAIIEKNRPDILVNCADTPIGKIQYWVTKSAINFDLPLVFGGVGINDFIVGPLLSSSAVKEKYLEQKQISMNMVQNNTILKGSISFTNTITGTFLAFEIFKYMTGIAASLLFNKTMKYDFFTGQFSTIKDWGNY